MLMLVFLTQTAFALDDNRYLENNKVIYEDPQEDDILKINTSIGFTTVLEFSDKPTMVTTGDSSLLQIEVPKNSKDVLIKALRDSGETNLFVFTPKQRFNYKVIVNNQQNVDYVVDVQKSISNKKTSTAKMPVSQLLKMAQNYHILKDTKQINGKIFTQKDLFTQFENPFIKLKIIESFVNKSPHYLILHFVIHNKQVIPIKLNEQKTNVYVNGQKFRPSYVVFDSGTLESKKETDGWLILEDTYISLNNQFTIGVGVYDKEHIF